jgi:predicted PurR-regulated permease PerM
MRFRLPRVLTNRAENGGERPDDRDGADYVGRADSPTAEAPTAPQRTVGGSTESPQAASSPPQLVVPRWIQLVLLPLGVLGLWALARASGPVLLILIFASTIALILNPVVKRLQRARIPRGLAILFVYLALFAAFAGVGVLLANPVSNQVNRFANDVPHFVNRANKDLADFQHWLNRHGIKVQIQQQGQTALQTLQRNVLKSSGNIVSFSRDLLGKVITISFDLVLVLVLSVYLLVYAKDIGNLARRIMPPGDGTPQDDFPLLVQKAVFGYVRGQLLFSLIMGASAGVLLWIIGTIGIFPDGARYAVFFGGFYGLMELIPYVGPILGALPPVLVALFNDPISALWVALMFVLLQQLEGHIVAPQVFRISLRINPILIILALLIGNQLYGIAGALVALPVAAVIRETLMYLRRHLVLEPWITYAGPGAGLTQGPPGPGGLPPPGPVASPPPEPEPEPEPDPELGPDAPAAYPLPTRAPRR